MMERLRGHQLPRLPSPSDLLWLVARNLAARWRANLPCPLSVKELHLFGRKSLVKATTAGDVKSIKKLIDSGADPNGRDETGVTPFMIAAESHHEVLALLMRAGADINAKDSIGQTALIRAAACGEVKVVEMLIEVGADITVTDQFGWTALARASQRQHADVVDLLREAAASEKNPGPAYRS